MRVPILFILGLFLPLAACRDREEVALHQLEERGHRFTVSDYHRAAADGDVPAVTEYLEAGMAVDVAGENGQTAFQIAAVEDHDELLQTLIEAGASPDQRLADENQRTLLMRVAGRVGKDLRMLDFLLENRADPLAVDSRGMTPLMVAALAGNVDGVRRLSERDVRSLDKALMLASAQGYTHCLAVLIERGAYVNCRSHDTQTPLMHAAGKGHVEATQLLLRHYANRFALDEDGRTAADRAEAAGQPALAATLRDTSNLLVSDVPANNEFLPSLDGQLIALLSEPMMNEVVGSLDPIEPDRPVLEFPTEGGSEETRTEPVSPPSSNVIVKPVIKKGDSIGTSAAVSSMPLNLQNELRLGRFEERFEPLLVTDVSGNQASVRLLGRPREEAMITVLVGQRIPNTSYEVTRMNKRVRPAKGGGMVDVSEVFVKSSQKEGEQRFVRNTLPRDEATHLVVEARRTQQRFAARMGDVFTIAETQKSYTVTDVRPHQLLIRNEETQEILTIERR